MMRLVIDQDWELCRSHTLTGQYLNVVGVERKRVHFMSAVVSFHSAKSLIILGGAAGKELTYLRRIYHVKLTLAKGYPHDGRYEEVAA